MPGAGFQDKTACASQAPRKVLSANQKSFRTPVSVSARNGMPSLSAGPRDTVISAAGKLIFGGWPPRESSSLSIVGKNGGGNFRGTPARSKSASKSEGQNS